MGIDYFIKYPCEAKSALTEKTIQSRLKDLAGANLAMAEREKKDGQKPNPANVKVVVLRRELFGETTKEEHTVQELFESVKPLRPFVPKCKGCPANFLNEPFGCYGNIKYPIEALTEQWLIERLPDDISSLRGKLLLRAIADFQYTGAPIDAMRKAGFFESSKPLVRKWGLIKRISISTSQILQGLFCVGDITPGHGILMSFFLGSFPPDMDEDGLLMLMQNATKLPEIPTADAITDVSSFQLKQLTTFRMSLYFAARLDQEIEVSA